MKRYSLLALVLFLGAISLNAQTAKRQHGTIIRMRMAECLQPPHGFMAAMSGAKVADPELCPEYVLVSDKVVYVIVGKMSGLLIPLAETTQFRIQKNELLVRVDDENRETKFQLREMVLRSEWDHVHPNLLIDQPDDSARPRLEPAVVEHSTRTAAATMSGSH